MFYDRLFEVAPQVKAMFPADMTEQRKKLMATLAVVVNGLANLECDPARRERAGQAPRRLRRQAGALSGGRRRAAVDAGKRPRRSLDARTLPPPGLRPTARLSTYMISEAYGSAQAAE